MIRRLAALILLSTLSQTVDLPQQLSMTVVEPGEDVSMTCLPFAEHKVGLFYWLKLKFGYMVQTVAAGSFQSVKLEREFQSSRFTITRMKTLNSLHIRNVSKEDEATYFCQAGTAYEMRVLNGTLLAVNDHKNQQKSVYVKQRPETQLVTEGDTVSLQCSLLSTYKESREQCPGEHSVYWFRAVRGDSHPAVIYSQSHRRDGEDRRSCAYSLSKTIHNSSDAGTYYCAVMTCGEILFGEGTTLKTKSDWWSFELERYIVTLCLLCATLAISVIVMIILIYGMKKSQCDKDAVSLVKMNPKREDNAWVYSAVIFTTMTAGSGAMTGKNQDRERIYAAVKAFGLD